VTERNVIDASARFPAATRRPSKSIRKSKRLALSQYDRYPLPFFNAKAPGGPSTWDVKPSGDYALDCETGQRYAVQFIESCDGSHGWSSLLQNIVADMVRAGPSGAFADGHPKVNGIVIGFMGGIGRALTAAIAYANEEHSA
jgi:hypothetical protein